MRKPLRVAFLSWRTESSFPDRFIIKEIGHLLRKIHRIVKPPVNIVKNSSRIVEMFNKVNSRSAYNNFSAHGGITKLMIEIFCFHAVALMQQLTGKVQEFPVSWAR